MTESRNKHDEGCRRRKVEMDMPYICTCDMTDEMVEQAQARGPSWGRTSSLSEQGSPKVDG